MSLGNSIRAAGITGQVISIEPSGRVCLLSSPLQNLPFYCLEKRWDKGTWKMWTTVYRLGKYVATNYRSRLPTPQDWLKHTRFICLTESEVGCPELVQVLRGLRDWASFYIFFLHRSSLDLLSILSTLWSQISCCSSNCCNFISTGRVSRSQEKKKKKCFLRRGIVFCFGRHSLAGISTLSLWISSLIPPHHTQPKPHLWETETWRILLSHSLEERKATERGCKSLLGSVSQNWPRTTMLQRTTPAHVHLGFYCWGFSGWKWFLSWEKGSGCYLYEPIMEAFC